MKKSVLPIIILLAAAMPLFAGPFGINLLANSGFENSSHFAGWTVTNGGSGWGVGSPGYVGSYHISSSYALCKVEQTISLISTGFSVSELDGGNLIVNWRVMVRGNGYNNTLYYARVNILDSSTEVIASDNIFSESSLGTIPINTEWIEASGTIELTGAGARYITFSTGGKDTNGWAGQYGASFDDASVILTYPSDTQEESGFNSTQETADVIMPGVHSVTISGTANADEEDWYRFQVIGGNHIWVNLLSGQVDLELYDSSSAQIGGVFGYTSGTMYADYISSEEDKRWNWLRVIGSASRGPYQVNINNPDDPTLPVELTSFTAIVTQDQVVEISWVVESETDLAGYNVFRNDEIELGGAIQVNDGQIIASNSTTQTTYTFTDLDTEYGTTYHYWLESVELDGQNQFYGPVSVTVTEPGEEDPGDTPDAVYSTTLAGAFPNPFNPVTTISYSLEQDGVAHFTMYDLKGRIVGQMTKTGKQGENTLSWDAQNLPSGIYFIRMNAAGVEETRKVMLLK